MKLSEQWLREWVNPKADTNTLADRLTMAGFEVDDVETAAPAFHGVVVGKVLDVNPHPDADKLKVCEVDVGQLAPLTIVCGASNVKRGMQAPVALDGAELPGGVKIKQSKVRGVASSGMLCSAKELGLTDGSDGLYELGTDAKPGTDIRRYLHLEDRLLVMELTPNRGDCLSVMGLAREVGVLYRMPLTGPTMRPVPATNTSRHEVRIEAAEACPHYAGRVIRNIRQNATTPLWMRERLRRCGIRSIHPVVDVTNYVMLELGQPMHAFDLDKLKGGIQVRLARAGEKIELLDGQVAELHASTLVIADGNGPVAMAGVMGGASTAVSTDTKSLFLESACFMPKAVAGQGSRYKAHTDSLHRFERGVDPELQVKAIERATALLLEIAGGEPGPAVSVHPDSGRKALPVRLRHSRLIQLLGAEVPPDQISDILQHLGMRVEMTGRGEWRVRPPSYRFDIALEADLIEEVARIHGYERLPLCPQQVELGPVLETESRLPATRLREALVHRGYDEVVTYSFVDAALQAKLQPGERPVVLDNPIAQTMGEMRTTLWSGLIPAWMYNAQRQQSRVRLFELGLRFRRDAGDGKSIHQEPMIAGLISGPALPEQWGHQPPRPADFYDLKADVEALLKLGGRAHQFRIEAAVHPALHPGKSARVVCDGQPVGWLGQLHPSLAAVLNIKEEMPLVFELQMNLLTSAEVPVYKYVSEFPNIRRDLSLELPEAVTAASLVACIKAAEDPLLRDVFIFDVYRGQGLQSGFKSIALGLIFQDYSRTLTDTEVDQSLSRLQERLRQELGATVRG